MTFPKLSSSTSIHFCSLFRVSLCQYSTASWMVRSVLLPGKDGTAGRTITRSECVWHVPCPSPRPQHGSASTASNRPQLCDTPSTSIHHLVAFRVLSSVSPNPFSSDFLPLLCAFSQRGARHIFVDTHLPCSRCCFKITRQKPPGVKGWQSRFKEEI